MKIKRKRIEYPSPNSLMLEVADWLDNTMEIGEILNITINGDDANMVWTADIYYRKKKRKKEETSYRIVDILRDVTIGELIPGIHMDPNEIVFHKGRVYWAKPTSTGVYVYTGQYGGVSHFLGRQMYGIQFAYTTD